MCIDRRPLDKVPHGPHFALKSNKGMIVAETKIIITPVTTKRDHSAWIDLVYTANAADPHFVPQLRDEEVKKYTPGGNPFFEHARGQLFLAHDDAGRVVGRISAHIDELVLIQPVEQGMGPGTGNWGALEADNQAIANALIATAEGWLREQGMTRVLAPMNLSVWEEPGLLVKGHDHPPTVMMGHQNAKFNRGSRRRAISRSNRCSPTSSTYRSNSPRSFSALFPAARRTRAFACGRWS